MNAVEIEQTRMVSVAALRELADPTVTWCWSCSHPKRWTMHFTAAGMRGLEGQPSPVSERASYVEHLHRVAWFYANGWDDPISVDVGCPVLGYAGPWWPILDGNHRFMAAILRRQTHLSAVVGGELDHANRILQPTIPW